MSAAKGQSFPTSKIGFIGWSQQSAAVLEALKKGRPGEPHAMPWLPLEPSGQMSAVDPAPNPRGLSTLPSVEAIFETCDLLFLAPPPEAMDALLPLMRLSISDRHTIVLLGMGWSLMPVLQHLQERKLVRALMAEFPATGAILMTYYASPYLGQTDREKFGGLFSHLDLALEMPTEAQFDAAMGLVGFAPAAFYTLMEALADGALVAGMRRDEARKLIAAMLSHTAGSMLHGEAHPATLREEALTDPAAAAALQELEVSGTRGVMMRALEKGLRELTRRRQSKTTK